MKLEVELDDESGELVGTPPDQLAALLKKIEDDTHKVAYGKGAEEAAKRAQKQIEDTVAQEKARLERELPYDRARLNSLEDENKTLSTKLTSETAEATKKLRAAEQKHAEDLMDRAKRIEAREDKIRKLARSLIRSDALELGAHPDSLDELQILIGARLGYTEDMEHFVADETGKPMMAKNGIPMSLKMYIAEYLDQHPHHRRAATGSANQRNRARGGATFNRTGEVRGADLDTARQRIDDGDRSPAAINDLFKAANRRAS